MNWENPKAITPLKRDFLRAFVEELRRDLAAMAYPAR
jgi:hypothetical protein